MISAVRLVLAALVLAPSLARGLASAPTPDEVAQFELWAAQHGRVYRTPDDRARRLALWTANARRVSEWNSAASAPSASRHVLALNDFADLSQDEYEERYTSDSLAQELASADVPLANDSEQLQAQRTVETRAEIPESYDWRSMGAVGPVKVQGQCGSCYAFAATGAIEAQMVINKYMTQVTSLSEQQIVDCCGSEYAAQGCVGGDPGWAMVCVRDLKGIVPAANYPYTKVQGKCRFNKSQSVARVSHAYRVRKGSESSLLSTLYAFGPTTVAIDARRTSFEFYSGGVYQDASCDAKSPNHAMLAVGWGVTSDGVEYYILKNQWGATWGERGYVLWPRNKNNFCGVANWCYIPEVGLPNSAIVATATAICTFISALAALF
eukprot:m51a1_g11765 putative cathepsin k (380) ;mRNA; f:230100-231567